MFKEAIEEVRANLGAPPREFGWWRRRHHRICPVRGDRRFDATMAHQGELFRHGRVVWSVVIQANSLLFGHGHDDCPAALVYSLDARMDGDPGFLEAVGGLLGSLKGEAVADPEIQVFADKLADEMVVDFALAIPKRVTRGVECFYTVVMLYRKHLPRRRLCGSLLPLLVLPGGAEGAIAVPGRYWPAWHVERVWAGDVGR